MIIISEYWIICNSARTFIFVSNISGCIAVFGQISETATLCAIVCSTRAFSLYLYFGQLNSTILKTCLNLNQRCSLLIVVAQWARLGFVKPLRDYIALTELKMRIVFLLSSADPKPFKPLALALLIFCKPVKCKLKLNK